jgi:hypothetical protein
MLYCDSDKTRVSILEENIMDFYFETKKKDCFNSENYSLNNDLFENELEKYDFLNIDTICFSKPK